MAVINKFFLLIFLFFFISLGSAAHFIVGSVSDSYSGNSANGREILIWDSTNISNNITDIIGTGGNSLADNFFMVDCELFLVPCSIGDILSVKVFDSGDGYLTEIKNVTVTGAGFDAVEAMLLKSPPIANYLYFDDDIYSPAGEVDLVAGSQRIVNCLAEIYDYENDSIVTIESRLFDESNSFFGDIDDNNLHYTNGSCFSEYIGNNATFVNCTYSLQYYANSGDWNCSINVSDFSGSYSILSNSSFINKLLSFSISEEIDYGFVESGNVTQEMELNISNYGNVKLNLSLQGYAVNEGDGLAMNCSSGENVSIFYQKYNLSESNPGNLSLSEFEILYKNLSSVSEVNNFNFSHRQDDLDNDAIKSSYWRVYAPSGVSGTCSGNIIFGATEAQEG